MGVTVLFNLHLRIIFSQLFVFFGEKILLLLYIIRVLLPFCLDKYILIKIFHKVIKDKVGTDYILPYFM